jgi:hypothetical protein
MESSAAVRTRGWKGRQQRKGIEGKRMSTCSGMLLFEFVGGGRGDDGCDHRGGDDGCGGSGEYGDTNERAVARVMAMAPGTVGTAVATARRAAAAVMAAPTSSRTAVVKRP